MTAEFKVIGEITGKARPRVLKSGYAYTPKKSKDYEQLVRLEYKRQCGDKFFGLMDNSKEKLPLSVYISVMYSIPKSYTKGKRLAAEHNMILPTKKPDSDNIAKIICDALNGVAYIDDTQIVSLNVNKAYTTGDAYVCVKIILCRGMEKVTE